MESDSYQAAQNIIPRQFRETSSTPVPQLGSREHEASKTLSTLVRQLSDEGVGNMRRTKVAVEEIAIH